jgi:hypothetical protein
LSHGRIDTWAWQWNSYCIANNSWINYVDNVILKLQVR